MRDSVVLVDDLDLGLGVEDVKRVYHYLKRHYLGSGNQFIFSCHSTDWLSGEVQVVDLGSGIDIVDKVVKIIAQKK